MNDLFTFFLLITILLIGIIATAQGPLTNSQHFNSLKSKLFRVEEAYAFVESARETGRTNYLIFSGGSPGWNCWR